MDKKTAIILIDHGSRIDAANEVVQQIASLLRTRGQFTIVEAAHMEIARPDLASAFAACVEQGAGRIVITPYFLASGAHATSDIPALAGQAAARHPGVEWIVAEPLGVDPKLADLAADRASEALARLQGTKPFKA